MLDPALLSLLAGLASGFPPPAPRDESGAVRIRGADLEAPEGAVRLVGPFRYQLGDDPRWAEPGYDDSDWPTADLWTLPEDFDGVIWFRIPVRLAPGVPYLIEDAYLYGFLTLLVSMSVYLARGFARTHRDLGRRLTEVRLLSEQRLEQELRVKSEEMARLELEKENERQALELEEANKRQAVLDELERTNRELRETQAHLVQSEKMASLGQLVAGIAHEVNTPVGAVHSAHDSLARAVRRIRAFLEEHAAEAAGSDKKLNAALQVADDALGVIRSGSSRVTTIVQRLKTFARLDEADLTRVDITGGLQDTLLLLHHELKHDITVREDLGELPRIACFPGQLNQVFLNLLVNARQAITGKGEITVRTRATADHVEIEITDTGSGIPPEVLPRIFDPGFTTKGVKVGTGLGLSICYRIVQDHDGEILVDSEVGRGATFTVRLPTDLERRLGRPLQADQPPPQAPVDT